MKYVNKELLFIDTETSGLPLTRKHTRNLEKYPSPTINIAYEQSRILSISFIISNNSDIKSELREIIRDRSDLTDASYTTNKNKYKEKGIPIGELINIIHQSLIKCDYVVGHNILFDLNILVNEAYRAGNTSCYDLIMNIIHSHRYFCTLVMMKILGANDYQTTLDKAIDYLNQGVVFQNNNYNFHESYDDVRATKRLFELGIELINPIPKSIHDITDIIYMPEIIGDISLKPMVNLVMYLKPFMFHYYVKTLSPKYCCNMASGRCEFYIECDLPMQLYTNDGCYTFNGVTNNCYYTCDDFDFKCKTCGKPNIGDYLCYDCAILEDEIIKYAEEFVNMEADMVFTSTTAEVKKLIPKDKSKRMKSLSINTVKKGRSYMLPNNKIDFYLEKSLYRYFSLKVGSVKL